MRRASLAVLLTVPRTPGSGFYLAEYPESTGNVIAVMPLPERPHKYTIASVMSAGSKVPQRQQVPRFRGHLTRLLSEELLERINHRRLDNAGMNRVDPNVLLAQ